MTKQTEITITAEQIEKLIAMASRHEQKACEYIDKGMDMAAARRDGISMGIWAALMEIGIEA